jgi:hypothetical protein
MPNERRGDVCEVCVRIDDMAEYDTHIEYVYCTCLEASGASPLGMLAPPPSRLPSILNACITRVILHALTCERRISSRRAHAHPAALTRTLDAIRARRSHHPSGDHACAHVNRFTDEGGRAPMES